MDAVQLIEGFTKQLFEEEKIKTFEDKLMLNESRMKNYKGFLLFSTIEGTILVICAIIALFEMWKNNYTLLVVICLISLICPFALNYLTQDIIFEKRKRQKEELLSDLLLEASVFCDESSAEETIKKISEQDFGLISKDFQRAVIEIKNGASIEDAFSHISERNKSKAYSRVISLILQGYKSGARMSQTLKETAEDLLETKAILKERQAVMLVTKYTLIMAAGLIIPAVLGLIINLVSGLNFGAVGEIGLGLDEEQRKGLFENAIIGTTLYVFEYSALSAFFLALQEGNKKSFWTYSAILFPLAGIIFFACQSIK
jgi:pilus assembly protein TadC